MTAAQTPAGTRLNYPAGVSLGLLAALSLSTGGVLLRSLESASGWQVLVYRSAAFSLLVLVLIIIRNQGRLVEPFRKIGGTGLIVAVALGIGFAAYVFAILNTTVANAMFVLSCAPIFAAIIARIVLGEQLSWLVWGIILIALGGIAIMVSSDISPGRLYGNLFALLAALTFAITVVLVRKKGDTDMLPATFLGGILAFGLAVYLAEGLVLSNNDVAVSLLLGTVQVGIGFICLTYAPRFILAAEVTLLTLLEPVLAPIWVWLVYNEVPSTATLYGGALVMACIVAFAVVALMEQRKRL
ncbi:MAG: DMT family transporter [Hyphomicrobiaceae bacterium]